ncbi:MAG: bifunctional folylpolyglutamate synthase/dihydrofolate synthase [Sphingomonas sp.]|nr:bifunctional folylpolyglutamate synthase/dihydrofolate synthase [Sphingomonas sp.]
MTSPAGDRLGLERISILLDRLGRPQDQLAPIFHVAGTNGKGSTIALLRAALEGAGHKVHAFTSPHLVRFNERIRIAGRLIDDHALEAVLIEVMDVSSGVEPSFFEVATAAAILAFARTPADFCLLEVGLGGRLDATNVIDKPLVSAIASIGIDHQQFLGSTLAQIAAEKAAIARSGLPLVALAQQPEAEAAIIGIADAAGARLLFEGRDWAIDPALVPALPGAHQIRNANLAWQMLEAQQLAAISREDFVAAITRVDWPGRLQRLGDGPLTDGIETWIDGAHNGNAAAALARHLAAAGPMHLVLGILANKDAGEIVGLLAPSALSLTFVPVPGHDHHDPSALAEQFGGTAAASVAQALSRLPAPRLIAGSLYLAGAALAANGETPT